jgi:transcriptional regulator with XRE-family HTH domain
MERQRLNAGQQLRRIREAKGLTIRDVETATMRLAQKSGNDEYFIPLSRLSDIETKGIVPSIFRLYSLAAVYRKTYRELATLYGIDLDNIAFEGDLVGHSDTHVIPGTHANREVRLPSKLDPAFHLSRTCNLGRLIEQWGAFPLAYLQRFSEDSFTYAYIGEADLTMYPLLLPGAFVQVDERKNNVVEGTWASEYERPIYFIETREGHTCSWCSREDEDLIVLPHPLSPVRPRAFKLAHEVEVIGQVVGVAMRLSSRPGAGKQAAKTKQLN